MRLDHITLMDLREYKVKARVLFEQFLTNPGLSDDNSGGDLPDSISNSAVKPSSADGSVGLPHVRVGHRQAFK